MTSRIQPLKSGHAKRGFLWRQEGLVPGNTTGHSGNGPLCKSGIWCVTGNLCRNWCSRSLSSDCSVAFSLAESFQTGNAFLFIIDQSAIYFYYCLNFIYKNAYGMTRWWITLAIFQFFKGKSLTQNCIILAVTPIQSYKQRVPPKRMPLNWNFYCNT